MKKRIMERLLLVEFIIIVLLLLWISWYLIFNSDKVELLHEISPDGNYVLIIEEQGKPFFFLYPDCIKVYLHENTDDIRNRYSVTIQMGIVTGGSTARYEIEWMEDGVQIILSGKESHYYILPFKTLEDAGKLL